MANQNMIDYNIFKSEIGDLNNLIISINNLVNILKKYPTGTSASNLGDLYKANFSRNSFNYTTSRRNLISDIKKFISSYSEYDNKSEKVMKVILEGMLSMSTKLTIALDYNDVEVPALKEYVNLLQDLKAGALNNMNNSVGKPQIWDSRIPTLESKRVSAYQSPAIDGYVDRNLTLKIQQIRSEEALTVANIKDLEFKELISKLENVTQVSKILYEKFPQLALKNALLRRNVDTKTRSGKEALEDYWRSKVRKKFGNDVPFCDEVWSDGQPVKVMTADGLEFFAKATDVVKGPNGGYQLKKDNANETLKKDYNDTNLGAY
jgi:hypothetical protein